MTGPSRWARRAPAVALSVALAAGALAGCKPASPSISVTGNRRLAVAADGTVSVALACAGTSPCAGKVRLKLDGVNGALRSYTVGAGATTSVALKLTNAQLARVAPGAIGSGEVRLEETSPAAVAPRGVAVIVARPAVDDEPPTSKAYRERNWTPTAFDTCSAELHRSFSVLGPDGKRYPTWHPPTVVDPATGETCTFSHEHGDDPATSDLYTWVTDFLNADQREGRGIPFGYVSEALDTYGPGHGLAARHEDNVGHKVVVANDVRLVTASPRGYLRGADGQPIACDVLMKVHQGSHSADALANNAHELLYAARCTDGTEVISSTLSRFGDPNEFIRSCEETPVVTTGSDLPAGDGGARKIPDRTCIDRHVLVPDGQVSSVWALYEVWKSENQLTTPSGAVLASFDPWFGIRNPARAHAGGAGNTSILDLVGVTDLVDPSDQGIACGYPFDLIIDHEEATGTQLSKPDPASPFDGAQRDFYLQTTSVANAGGPTTWYTDPYGADAVAAPRPGLVRQHVSATSNAAWPALERRAFDLERDHGAGNGVHAPN